MKRASCVLLAPVLAIVLAACGGSKTEKFNINAVSANGKSAFSVGTITVTEGDKVELAVGNTTDRDHGFSIDAFDIHRVVKPNEKQRVTFTPKRKGEFRIYCQLHPAHVPAQLVVVG